MFMSNKDRQASLGEGRSIDPAGGRHGTRQHGRICPRTVARFETVGVHAPDLVWPTRPECTRDLQDFLGTWSGKVFPWCLPLDHRTLKAI